MLRKLCPHSHTAAFGRTARPVKTLLIGAMIVLALLASACGGKDEDKHLVLHVLTDDCSIDAKPYLLYGGYTANYKGAIRLGLRLSESTVGHTHRGAVSPSLAHRTRIRSRRIVRDRILGQPGRTSHRRIFLHLPDIMEPRQEEHGVGWYCRFHRK